MLLIKNKVFRRVLLIVIGGLLGYAYYYFVGCNNGCPIQSNPYVSTIYSAAIGGILSFPTRNNKNKS
jgi:uncharacterized membrane protein YjjB (DUF3815 family)